MRNNDALPLPSEDPQPAAPSLGRMLRAAREAEHWSIEEVAAELRIEPRFLAALEDERFEAVGPPVFTKGYLKLYCGCLGLDFAQLLPLYKERIGTAEAPLRGRRSVEHRESSNGARWVAIGLAALVLIGLAVWLLSRSQPAVPVQAPASGTPSTGAAASPGAASNPVPAAAVLPGTNRTSAAAAVFTEGAEPASETPQNPISALQQALLRRDAGQGEASRSAAPLTEAGPAGLPTAAGPESAAAPRGAVFTKVLGSAANGADLRTDVPAGGGQTGLEIELRFLQDSWVEVTDARNQRLYYGLAKAGDESRVRGVPPLEVLLGNADGVVVEVAGHPYRYPNGGRRGKLARFSVTDQAQ
ncbi:MAG TPA: RodZ domain-containing protein [Gammaproteobacteria bacterium]|nr:RodZ domain-containing protein [Gammaproteobacteria bacterium]